MKFQEQSHIFENFREGIIIMVEAWVTLATNDAYRLATRHQNYYHHDVNRHRLNIDFVQYGGTDIGGLLEEGEHLPQAGHHGHLGRLVDHLYHHQSCHCH